MKDEKQFNELLDFFKALSDETRIKILALLMKEPYSVEEIAEILGLTSATISHHLSKLTKAGLVRARAEGYYNMYEFNILELQYKANRILSREAFSPITDDLDLEAYDRKVLETFLDESGRVSVFPSQKKKEEVILRYAAKLFKSGEKYNEKKVNNILEKISDDTARLRRNLVEFGIMQREGGGGDYWLVD